MIYHFMVELALHEKKKKKKKKKRQCNYMADGENLKKTKYKFLNKVVL